ncbi:uncharacterized protein LOC124834237 [Vigna umbellata]|uniref:uncharacterized protein LOC124834236 n=1 Tax=Vigna umbellata TaxID=87088 RepID=UPI001F5ECB6D|nr:uncharacterized protein LOC124834236 [Vigna umbellata]XP_047164844.1 uncharacterized protein LOC124834237 [Vigna umbellata]
MNSRRYALPLLAFFILASFVFTMRSPLLEKISRANTDEALSLILHQLTHQALVNEPQQKAVNEAESLVPAAPRKMCGYTSDMKKAALQKLEDVLLEPPRAASMKSRKYSKRTRFLPDLMGDSLVSYPRRVFIDVELSGKEGGSGTKWFMENYPTRNMPFEMYDVKTVAEELQQNEEIGMSDWLRKNVKEEEFVVMKAEAEVVEDMVKSNSIGLVDELFLECKPNLGRSKGGDTSRRAYWECLALYGQLKDEGVAVHQWWG